MKIIYTDGFTIGKNPSQSGGGFILVDENGLEIDRQTFYKEKYTNNEGELMGVLETSKIIENEGEIYTDSKNTCYWVNNCKCKARPDLKPFAQKAKINILEKKLKLIWIPREENLAGQLSEEGNEFRF